MHPLLLPPQAPMLQEAGIQQSFLFGEKYITIALFSSRAFAKHTGTHAPTHIDF